MFAFSKRYLLELGAALVFTFAFASILNFIWESFHAVYLYKRHNMEASLYIPMILYVSIIDGLLIDGLYLATGLVWRKMLWIRQFHYLQALLFVAGGILTAGCIEYRAVYLMHRWSYAPGMPTVFGLGLSPLVQLGITGLFSLWITKEILFGKGILER
jgi:hypothetical protein